MNHLFLGGDVSKGYCDFVILNKQCDIIEEVFQLDDTNNGYKKLEKILLSTSIKNENSGIIAGFESTGGYENKWIESIKTFDSSLNVKTIRINPTVVHASDKTTLKKNKTDKISAISIAKYLIRFEDELDFSNGDKWFHLRQQWKYITILTKQKVQLQQYLEKLLYTYNPSLIVHCKDNMPNWLLSLLSKYPTGKRLNNAKTSAMIKIPYITKEKAKFLKKEVKKNKGIENESIERIITDIVKQIRNFETRKKKYINILKSYLDEDDIEILTSFKGIDEISAIGLLCEIGDIKRFETAKQLVGFVGVHPVYRESGDGKYGMHMSKQGRPQAKKILYMITVSAIAHNKDIRRYYLKKQLQGKEKMPALGACMHKILRIIWTMLVNRTKFVYQVQDHQIDELEHRLKNIKQRDIEHFNNERRKKRIYQDFDDNAPVSRREYIKRKEYYTHAKKK